MRKPLFLLLVFWSCMPLHADGIVLVNGDLIQGSIQEITAVEVLIVTDYGAYIIAMKQIREILFETPLVQSDEP